MQRREGESTLPCKYLPVILKLAFSIATAVTDIAAFLIGEQTAAVGALAADIPGKV